MHMVPAYDMEPILAPNRSRFTLFPIEYPKVSTSVVCGSRPVANKTIDMGSLQDGASLVLDRRRNREDPC